MVEFHKGPKGIDKAVDHVVYCHETGRRPKANDEKQRHYSMWAEVDDSEKDDSSSDDDISCKIWGQAKEGPELAEQETEIGECQWCK